MEALTEDKRLLHPTERFPRIGYRHNKILTVCRETKIRKNYSQNIFCFDVFCDFEFQNLVFGV